jgi:hypothetical protein
MNSNSWWPHLAFKMNQKCNNNFDLRSFLKLSVGSVKILQHWNVTANCAVNMWSVGQVPHCGYIAALMALTVRAILRLYCSTEGTVCTCHIAVILQH